MWILHDVADEPVHDAEEHCLRGRDERKLICTLVKRLTEERLYVLDLCASLEPKHEVGAEHQTARVKEKFVL